jgi:hypothetical protein
MLLISAACRCDLQPVAQGFKQTLLRSMALARTFQAVGALMVLERSILFVTRDSAPCTTTRCTRARSKYALWR